MLTQQLKQLHADIKTQEKNVTKCEIELNKCLRALAKNRGELEVYQQQKELAEEYAAERNEQNKTTRERKRSERILKLEHELQLLNHAITSLENSTPITSQQEEK
eukprot:560196-Rhodomonas_salina.1